MVGIDAEAILQYKSKITKIKIDKQSRSIVSSPRPCLKNRRKQSLSFLRKQATFRPMAVRPGREPRFPAFHFLLCAFLPELPHAVNSKYGITGSTFSWAYSSSSSGSRSQAQPNFTPIHFSLRSHFTWFSRRCRVLPQAGPLLNQQRLPISVCRCYNGMDICRAVPVWGDFRQ